jgi:3-hydroxyacyl-CoA dehydrogenase/enoyl-CoA hydratase/3-hydroxybutyryl-CoA epimerase
VNVLGAPAAAAFAALLDRLDGDPAIRACVLRSGKADGFIAGADIEQFRDVHAPADAEALSRAGQAMADRVERCRVPIVAAVHGACLGGGLEVALACAWRVASEHAKTTFALPEVQLGLIPGMGGTQRLPRRIGLQAALDMILTGKTVRAKKALALGLVDDLVHPAGERARAPRAASSSTTTRSGAPWCSARRASRRWRRPAATTRPRPRRSTRSTRATPAASRPGCAKRRAASATWR